MYNVHCTMYYYNFCLKIVLLYNGIGKIIHIWQTGFKFRFQSFCIRAICTIDSGTLDWKNYFNYERYRIPWPIYKLSVPKFLSKKSHVTFLVKLDDKNIENKLSSFYAVTGRHRLRPNLIYRTPFYRLY